MKGVIPVKNMVDVHTQDFLTNDELLLRIMKPFTQCPWYLLLEMLGVCSVC